MNFAFYNAYQKSIYPLISGVLWTEQQRDKAANAIMQIGRETIDYENSDFQTPFLLKEQFDGCGNLVDAWLEICGTEYRDIRDFENICWNMITNTAQKPSRKNVSKITFPG